MDKDRITGIWEKIRKTGRAIVNGDYLMLINAEKLLVPVIVLIVLSGLSLIFGLYVDSELYQVEVNKKELRELNIEYTKTLCDYTSYQSISKVQELLEQHGSQLMIPENPPMEIKE